MAEEHFRRTSDLGSINLDALIAAENDSGKRTLLLILSSLNNNLMENTKTTETVSVDLARHLKIFNSHVVADEERLNKGKGMWKILAAVLAIAQVAVSYTVVTMVDRLASYDRDITALQIENVKIWSSVGRSPK